MARRSRIRHFAALLSHDRGRVTLVVVTSLLIALGSLLDPWLRKLAVDRGMLARDQSYLLRIVWILLWMHLAQTVGGCSQAAARVRVGTSIILFTAFDWRLAVLLHLLIPVMMLASFLFRKVVYEAFSRTRETLGAVTEHLHQSVAGIRVIKAVAHERRSQQRFEELNHADFQANVYAGAVFAFFFPIVELLMGTGLCI